MNLLDINLFENLEKDIIDLVSKNVFLKIIKQKETIVFEDDISISNLYIVNSGVIIISKTDSHGNERALSLKREGEPFGYLSIIDKGPRHGKASALIDSKYWVLDGSFVENYLLKDIQFNLNLMKVYTAYIRNSDDLNGPTYGKTAQKKLLFQLLRIGNISNQSFLCTIDSHINQTVISSFTGLARETVSREIKKLKTMNIITTENKDKMQLDIEKCKKLLQK
jgi:CRP/FNR family transcriptional regulator